MITALSPSELSCRMTGVMDTVPEVEISSLPPVSTTSKRRRTKRIELSWVRSCSVNSASAVAGTMAVASAADGTLEAAVLAEPRGQTRTQSSMCSGNSSPLKEERMAASKFLVAPSTAALTAGTSRASITDMSARLWPTTYCSGLGSLRGIGRRLMCIRRAKRLETPTMTPSSASSTDVPSRAVCGRGARPRPPVVLAGSRVRPKGRNPLSSSASPFNESAPTEPFP
mmetsp:Transcript_14932/g.37854  ORF Transcript_14932/g.37854 Transcript_14932/m.37854 type:complete len:227 (+) Transcript_14932:2237-2917(+)